LGWYRRPVVAAEPSVLSLTPLRIIKIKILNTDELSRSISKLLSITIGEIKYSPGVLFSTSSRPVLGPTQPPIQWVPGTLSPGVKRPRREANNSPPTSNEVKKTWIYTCTSPYTFMA
jgi:hypothetical protein